MADKGAKFDFQQFSINQDKCAMKVGIDSVLLGAWCPLNTPKNILDIGTGTGLLALMMAQRTNAHIDAVEIERQAFTQAKENIQNSNFHHRISVHHKAIQKFKHTTLYDLIISNPPYFKDSLPSTCLVRSVARHNDTLSFYELFHNASKCLNIDGLFVLILPHKEVENITQIAQKEQLFLKEIVHVTGKPNKAPNRALLCFSKQQRTVHKKELSIYNTEGRYSNDFQELTQDFYLPSILSVSLQ